MTPAMWPRQRARGVVACAALACLVSACGAAAASRATPPPSRHAVTSLPGYTGPPLHAWSGYVDVSTGTHRSPGDASDSSRNTTNNNNNNTATFSGGGRYLFYYHVESDRAASTDPLVFWFTGGPGCSSLFGMLYENGPHRVHGDGTVGSNVYSWSRVANMVWVESPVGVGFSYDEDGNYTTGDDAAAADNQRFVHGFLAAYPEYQGRPIYLAGESFAGHYVPQLASLMAHEPAATRLPLQGWLVGNPSFDFTTDVNAWTPFMAYAGLLDFRLFSQAAALCDGHFYGPNVSAACAAIVSQLRSEVLDMPIDPYNVYANCSGPGPDPHGGCLTQTVMAASAAEAGTVGAPPPPLTPLSQTFVPCVNVTAEVAYLRRADVRAALGVVPSSFEWDVCSAHINYTQYAPTMAPIYLDLARSLRVLVYSGDADSCVPFPGTEACVNDLGFAVEEAWRFWMVDGGQIGGGVRTYNTSRMAGAAVGGRDGGSSGAVGAEARGSGAALRSLRPAHGAPGVEAAGGAVAPASGAAAGGPGSLQFATVHGCSHMVPHSCPGKALRLFEAYVSGQLL